jgi:hypothetical protein
MKLEEAIRAVLEDERALARELQALRERHTADHDVYHLAETLRLIAQANLERLAPYADGDGEPPRPLEGADLLADLRALHLLYAQASIDYVILGQGAQAARDRDVLDAVSQCHTQTLRGMKWTVTRIKTAAPQVLVS